MKTKKELDAIKEEVETLNKKLAELNDEEMAYISGGSNYEEPNVWTDWLNMSGGSQNNGGETVWDKIE